MSDFQNMEAFWRWLPANQGKKPLHQFEAGAAPRDTLPTFVNTLPGGTVFVFADLLVFSTLDSGQPGLALMGKRFIQENVETWKTLFRLKSWVENPLAFLESAAQWLYQKYPKKDQLERVLVNPNSFCLPFSQVRKVESGRYWQGNYVKIATRNQSYLICNQGRGQNLFQLTRALIGGIWQPDLVARLQQAAQANQSRAQTSVAS
jgi:hypothetical protein